MKKLINKDFKLGHKIKLSKSEREVIIRYSKDINAIKIGLSLLSERADTLVKDMFKFIEKVRPETIGYKFSVEQSSTEITHLRILYKFDPKEKEKS